MLNGLNFTPVLDILIIKYEDVYPALIFGKIFRYQQCKNGYCSASYKTIGDDLAISKSTVARHISKLLSDFFILDVSPKDTNSEGITRRYITNQKLMDTIVRETSVLKENNGTVVTKSVKDSILYIVNTSIIYYELSLTTVPEKDCKTEYSFASYLSNNATMNVYPEGETQEYYCRIFDRLAFDSIEDKNIFSFYQYLFEKDESIAKGIWKKSNAKDYRKTLDNLRDNFPE